MKKQILSIIFLIFLGINQIVFAATNPAPGPQPIPQPRPQPPMDLAQSTLCKSACTNGVQSLTFMTISTESGTRACPEKATMAHSCSPYGCDNNARNCKISCAANSDCASGFACLKGTCTTVSYYCDPTDDTYAVGTDGSRYDCHPYRCQSGQCIKRCGSTNDCVAGAACDLNPGVCVVIPQ